MKTRLFFLPLLIMLVASLAACGGGASVPADAIAMVGSVPVTRAEFNTFFKQALNIAKAQGQTIAPGSETYTQMQNQTIAYLVQVHELEQQAPKEHVAVSQADVTKYLTNLAKTSYKGSMKKLEAALKKQGLTMETAREEVFVNLLAEKIHKKVTASAKVTTAQLRSYYTIHLSDYTTPEVSTRKVEHILVKAKSLAVSIHQKLVNGESFATLAKKYSKDPGSAAQGGLFTATKGSEVPAYDASAFSLKNGELSGLVDSTSAENGSFGWFIIKALGPVKTVKAHTTSFKDAQAKIKTQLLQQQVDQLWSQWLADLKSEWESKVSYQAGYAPPTTTALTDTATLPTATG